MSGWLMRPTAQTGMSTASRTARARCRQMPIAGRRRRPVVDARHAAHVVAGDHVQVVDRGRLSASPRATRRRSRTCRPSPVELVADQPHADDAIAVPMHVAHRLSTRNGKRSRFASVAAVLVVAVVHQRRHERAEQVAPRDRDLDAVESPRRQRSAAVAVLLDHGRPSRPRLIAARRLARISSTCSEADTTSAQADLGRARMHQLGEHPPALLVHGLGEALVAGHDRLVAVDEHPRGSHRFDGTIGVAPVICMAKPLRARARW